MATAQVTPLPMGCCLRIAIQVICHQTAKSNNEAICNSTCMESSRSYRSHEELHEPAQLLIVNDHGFVRSKGNSFSIKDLYRLRIAPLLLSHLQYAMPITVCPIAREGGRCLDVQCHLRHDIVKCSPCRCFVLHGGLAKHRRGEEHVRNCGFPVWKARAKARRPSVIPPLPYPRVPVPMPRKPIRSRAVKITTGGTSNRSGQDPRVVVSNENGLTLKSTTSMIATARIVIQKVRQNDSLALVDVDLTGAESNW